MSATAAVDLLGLCFELDPGVALRPEPFGALAYHFGTRRLTFLKTPELADVVRRLGESGPLADALARAGVPEGQWPAYAKAVAALLAAGMIRERPTVAA